MPSRCPNGTRRNKKTGNCESTTQTQMKKRCPKGTQKNKKTGNCESTQMKKRCPKGTHKNKKTGICESIHQSPPHQSPDKKTVVEEKQVDEVVEKREKPAEINDKKKQKEIEKLVKQYHTQHNKMLAIYNSEDGINDDNEDKYNKLEKKCTEILIQLYPLDKNNKVFDLVNKHYTDYDYSMIKYAVWRAKNPNADDDEFDGN